jgi:predicted ATP-grasp superfamily ATP-dependent carboligase
LGRRAIEAVPGLKGYVGVDLVLADDGADQVIEINPRLTTSYLGLRALAETNLAEAMLAIATGRPLPKLRWQAGPVHFRASGEIGAFIEPAAKSGTRQARRRSAPPE